MKVIYNEIGMKIIPETPFEASYLCAQGQTSKLVYGEHSGLDAMYVDDDISAECRGKTVIYITQNPNKYGTKKETNQ